MKEQQARLSAYAGLSLLFLLLFYLFYRDIKRYRPALIADTRKMFLLAFLLLATVILAQFSKHFFILVADKLQLDTATIGFALPVAAGAMLVSLLLDFHLALGFSFVVSILLGISFQGDPFIPLYYFLGSIVAALVGDPMQKENSRAQGRRSDRAGEHHRHRRHRFLPRGSS